MYIFILIKQLSTTRDSKLAMHSTASDFLLKYPPKLPNRNLFFLHESPPLIEMKVITTRKLHYFLNCGPRIPQHCVNAKHISTFIISMRLNSMYCCACSPDSVDHFLFVKMFLGYIFIIFNLQCILY